ncbi:MAG: AmmeMemoRadiSam system protein B [Caldilineaceae bacterium]|nr:AmmeMemoRadiSam system protein B [Caldilineaceae bacterium]
MPVFAPRIHLAFPKLRAVDVQTRHQNGHAYYLLADPLELAEDSLLVPQAFGPVLALCDGTLADAAAIRYALARRYQMTVDVETVGDVLAALDEACLLENERSAEAIQRKIVEYRALPARPTSHAGLAYPDDPAALTRLLDSYLHKPISPRGVDDSLHRNGSALRRDVRGIFSPHIDYTRGGPVYARTWQAGEEAANDAELVILIGTDHYGNDLFTLTRQSYATPFGLLPTDTDVVDELAQAAGSEAAYAGEMRHQREHSLELVAVWLQHARRRKPVALVPVLVGGLHRFFGNSSSPSADSRIRAFVETVQRHATHKKTLVVASGDLSHVGPAFGGQPLTQASRIRLRSADDGLLVQMTAGDGEGFYRSIRGVQDRNNVCGVTPGYLTLKILGEGVRGARLAYDTCSADEADTSAVTIGGVVFG